MALSLALVGGCKDKAADAPMKPVGPAGAEGQTGTPAATGASGTDPQKMWPDPVVTETQVEGGVQLVSKVMASPPSTTTKGDDQSRLAMGAAQMKAQVALLKAIEKRRGNKLGGDEIPGILSKVKVVEAKELEGGAVSVSLGYVDTVATKTSAPK
jgi:hypothetical protein